LPVRPGTTARFTNSSFTGAFVDFSYADFQSATLDFIDADWEHPPHFDDFPDGPPEGLRLPNHSV
jgi:hypothetical protein